MTLVSDGKEGGSYLTAGCLCAEWTLTRRCAIGVSEGREGFIFAILYSIRRRLDLFWQNSEVIKHN